jgi:hypothetical protein
VQAEALQHLLGVAREQLVLLALVSGVVNRTSSTLSNWCWRMSPRTSRPWLPASARKHGVYAAYATGSFGLEDLVRVQVRDGDLGRRDQVEVVAASPDRPCGS